MLIFSEKEQHVFVPYKKPFTLTQISEVHPKS